MFYHTFIIFSRKYQKESKIDGSGEVRWNEPYCGYIYKTGDQGLSVETKSWAVHLID